MMKRRESNKISQSSNKETIYHNKNKRNKMKMDRKLFEHLVNYMMFGLNVII